MSKNLSLKGLWNDTDGIILPYVTVLLVVIIGLMVLALDGARTMSLQTQLQNAADKLALAAAAELDGAPNAIARADNALEITRDSFPSSTLFGTGLDKNVRCPIDPSCRRYLKALPASDKTTPITNTFVTTDDLEAQFVEVTVKPVTARTILPASFFGGSNSFTGAATAVAGFGSNVCKFTPMYVCNPWEPIGNTDYDAATRLIPGVVDPTNPAYANPDALVHRQMITLRYDPGGPLNPGNFGFLVSPLTNGFAALRDTLARVKPGACFSRRGVTTQTGFGAEGINTAFNVRFDIWDGAMNGNRNDVLYAPAPDVRKGYTYTGTACNATYTFDTNPTSAMPLPIDNPAGTPPLGTGTWNFDTYWSVEHPFVAHPTVNDYQGVARLWGNSTYLPSRYTVYSHEVDLGKTPVPPPNNGNLLDRSPGKPAPEPRTGERGAPECSTSPPAPKERRTIYTAILNCRALTSAGIMGGGKNTDIPVARYGKYFLIHAIPRGPATESVIDAEFLGLVESGDNVVKNEFQLYR